MGILGDSTDIPRVISVTVPGIFDIPLYYQCPDCGAQWHRFDLTSRQYHVAAKHMKVGEDGA